MRIGIVVDLCDTYIKVRSFRHRVGVHSAVGRDVRVGCATVIDLRIADCQCARAEWNARTEVIEARVLQEARQDAAVYQRSGNATADEASSKLRRSRAVGLFNDAVHREEIGETGVEVCATDQRVERLQASAIGSLVVTQADAEFAGLVSTVDTDETTVFGASSTLAKRVVAGSVEPFEFNAIEH